MICDICKEEVAVTYQNEFCGDDDRYGHLECVQEIQNYLEETQRGKSGMYPYRVASDIAVKWQISLEEAYKYVNEYIKKESEDKEKCGTKLS